MAEKHHRVRLHTQWSDDVSQSGKQDFEIYYRDTYLQQSKPSLTSNCQDVFRIFLVNSPHVSPLCEDANLSLSPGIIYFFSPGTIISSQSSINKQDGYICSFSSDFFKPDTLGYSLFHYPFFNAETTVCLALDTAQTAYFYTLLQEMEQQYQALYPNKTEMVRALLTVLMEKARQLVKSDVEGCLTDNSNAGIRLSKAFIRGIETDFRPIKSLHMIEIKPLAEYASELHVTKNHLNDTIKVVLGKTPGELIRERILTEASQLLRSTQLDIIEIGFLLKFEDPSYFSRFFKRYSGQTPTQYRKNLIK